MRFSIHSNIIFRAADGRKFIITSVWHPSGRVEFKEGDIVNKEWCYTKKQDRYIETTPVLIPGKLKYLADVFGCGDTCKKVNDMSVIRHDKNGNFITIKSLELLMDEGKITFFGTYKPK